MKYYLAIMTVIGVITYHYATVAVDRQVKAVSAYTNAVDAAVRGTK